MSHVLHLLALSLYGLGIAVVIATIIGALMVRRVYNRLHYLTPATSLGAPLIGLALAIENGWSLTTAEIVFTVGLLAIAGPVLEAATGRVAAQREGMVGQESPE